MKLSKGKISKIIRNKNQSRKKFNKIIQNHKNTFRKKKHVNLNNKTQKNIYLGGKSSSEIEMAPLKKKIPNTIKSKPISA